MPEKIKKILQKVFNKSNIPYVKKALTIGVFLLLFANMIYITLIFYDREYDFKLLNKTYMSAVYQGQDINNILETSIIKVEAFDIDTVTEDSYIITYGDYNTNEYWVNEVASVDSVNNVISYTYDGIVSTSINADDIVAIYTDDASLVGTIYYGATFSRGYILLTILHLFIFSIYYFSVYPHKEDENEEDTN